LSQHPLRRLLAFSRPYRGRFMLALAAMLVYAGASTGVAYLIKPIIDHVLPGTGGMPFSFWAVLIVGAYLAKGIGSYFSTYLMTDVGQRVVRDIRDRLFRHILDQSAAFFSRRSTGQLMSRITNDVNQIQQAVSETIGDLIREGLTAVGWMIAMFYFD
jgi:ATP-binding cassette, subfamily B, bacterial MsbA